MTRDDMICGNCINGEHREVGGVTLVKCFFNPEPIMKGYEERCGRGAWWGMTTLLSRNRKVLYYWGEWNENDEQTL